MSGRRFSKRGKTVSLSGTSDFNAGKNSSTSGKDYSRRGKTSSTTGRTDFRSGKQIKGNWMRVFVFSVASRISQKE
jgi:hypothetical protein